VNLKEIDENVKYGLGSLLIWMNCIRAPAATCQALLNSGLSDDQKMFQAMRIWIIGTLMGLIVQLPVYGFLHMSWAKIEFYAPALLLLLLAFLTTVVAIHFGLKIYGIQSAFPDTLVIYSVIVGTFSILLTPLSLPGLIDLLTALKAAKAAGAQDISAVVQIVFGGMQSVGSKSIPMQVFEATVTPVNLAVVLALTVSFQRQLSSFYKAETSRAVSALSFSMAVLLPPPMILLLGLYYFTVYVAL
jgi:hypothetical protein